MWGTILIMIGNDDGWDFILLPRAELVGTYNLKKSRRFSSAISPHDADPMPGPAPPGKETSSRTGFLLRRRNSDATAATATFSQPLLVTSGAPPSVWSGGTIVPPHCIGGAHWMSRWASPPPGPAGLPPDRRRHGATASRSPSSQISLCHLGTRQSIYNQP